jgi:RNA polymerase sigma-70 factor (ECF subfamily)
VVVTKMQDCRPDQELAQRALGGDGASWREIYEATFDRLFSLLYYQVGDRDEVMDLLQETYLQAFRNLGQYRGEAPLEIWLRAIALRKAKGWRRRLARALVRTVRLVGDPPSEERGGPAVHFESERAALRTALKQLSSCQREALLLREWEEMSFREVAAVLGCAEATARVHHARARARMRTLLGSEGYPRRVDGPRGKRS